MGAEEIEREKRRRGEEQEDRTVRRFLEKKEARMRGCRKSVKKMNQLKSSRAGKDIKDSPTSGKVYIILIK